ncbi:TetR/AcrR family transcriptional regulator [Sphingomonas sp. KC8]|uniref:TetR/AcrR family transcriptional regulator n=1 Tax=Sphingomonas sp. KC8 TaxID=1030157 RepID=UPI000248A796|nr:TetR/AcrR family transcriptional regulator [Sphingomonas sp. KC8]ARS26865.1 transcriptional regulator [Sphingomonas sp. KC8]
MSDTAEKTAGGPVRRRGRPAQNAAHAVDEGTLLALAFQTFAERGYEGTTLREIAKQLGVSHNLINVRFGKKADLWKRAVDWRLGRASLDVAVAFDVEDSPEARLRTLVHLFCRWATFHTDIVSLTHVEGYRNTWRLDYIVQHFILPFKERLDALVHDVALIRPVSPISTPALMALLVQGVGYFFGAQPLQQRIGAGPLVEPRHAEEQAVLMADFLLAGLLPAK